MISGCTGPHRSHFIKYPMQEIIPINILIGDRSYRIKIAPKDEETVRKAVKVINEKVIEYKTQFAGKDMQDYIAMVLVWFATQKMAHASNQLQRSELQAKLDTIESALDKIIPDKKSS
jgi:cell division protein ZapA (FtsZ GTPase activity inhibitor)